MKANAVLYSRPFEADSWENMWWWISAQASMRTVQEAWDKHRYIPFNKETNTEDCSPILSVFLRNTAGEQLAQTSGTEIRHPYCKFPGQRRNSIFSAGEGSNQTADGCQSILYLGLESDMYTAVGKKKAVRLTTIPSLLLAVCTVVWIMSKCSDICNTNLYKRKSVFTGLKSK